jgi:hypothetical protein
LKSLPLPSKSASKEDDLLAGMSDAFGEKSAEVSLETTSGAKIGSAERRVYDVVNPTRTVQDIIDLARLGEFETTKALANLVSGGFLRVVMPALAEKPAESEPFTVARLWGSVAPVLTRVALYAVVACAVGGLVKLASTGDVGVLATDAAVTVQRAAVRDETGDLMRVRLTQAIETYRLMEGHYPAKLEDLVECPHCDGPLVDEHELTFPFQTKYAYRATGDGYALSLPLR